MTGGGAGIPRYIYAIASKENSLVLDVKKRRKHRGAHVIMFRNLGHRNQMWYDDLGRIRSDLNGFCLEIEGKTTPCIYTVLRKNNNNNNNNNNKTLYLAVMLRVLEVAAKGTLKLTFLVSK